MASVSKFTTEFFLNKYVRGGATWRIRRAVMDAHKEADFVLRLPLLGSRGRPGWGQVASGQASHRDRRETFSAQ